MKVRSGFVSNSSSSSFIVVLDEEPTVDSLIRDLYRCEDVVEHNYDNSTVYDTRYLAEYVHGALTKDGSRITTFEELAEEIDSGSFDDPDVPEVNFETQWKLEQEEHDKEDLIERPLRMIEYDKTGKYTEEEKEAAKQALWKIMDAKWKAESAQHKVIANKIATRLWEANKGKLFYKVVFGDENGSLESHLEHGGTFDNVTSLRISHH